MVRPLYTPPSSDVNEARTLEAEAEAKTLEAEAEAEAKTLEAEAEDGDFGLEAEAWPRGLTSLLI